MVLKLAVLFILATAHELPPVVPEGLGFYMYEDPALDQSWLRQCAGFDELKDSAEGEGMQEANLHPVLRDHPYRTRNASRAALFYIPIWEYSSFRLGACNGSTHASRMLDASRALHRSEYLVRSGGRDHFWASSMAVEVTHIPDARRPGLSSTRVTEYVDKHKPIRGMHLTSATLMQRLFPMHKLLSETSVGRMKAFGRFANGDSRHSGVVGRCTFDMGHQPNQAALRAFPPAGSARPTFLSFAGGLDVCCTGHLVRCRVGSLLLKKAEDVVIDIGLRGDVLRQMRNGTAPPCTLAALTALSAERKLPLSLLVEELVARGGQDELHSDKYERMGQMMASSVFCLCPAGDICTTSRFVTALAAGCIPVVLCDGLQGPFGEKKGSHLTKVPYESFWVKFPVGAFIRRPESLLERLRAMSASEIATRQAALRAHRINVLLQVPRSQAGTRFLEEVADCVELNRQKPIGRGALRAAAPRTNLAAV